jgi:SAM-dependent methyltransferase
MRDWRSNRFLVQACLRGGGAAAYPSRMTAPSSAAAAAMSETALPDEPLALSAPLARAFAATLCHVDPRHGGSCAWYHGLWQYLRLFDFVTTPRDHAVFYRAALLEPLRAGARRVLISGTADYALPACLLWLYRSAGVPAEMTVLDICRTPLRLCEWFADRIDAPIATVAQDILEYRPVEAFDVICTHAFLGRFQPAERAALIARWHGLLRPGGRVVTVNRIRPDAPETVRFTGEQSARFVERIRQAAQRAEPPLDLSADTLVAMAQAYVAAKRTVPVRSTDELVALFEAAGFRIEQLAVGAVESRTLRAPAGPTMSGGAQYARIVAVRA